MANNCSHDFFGMNQNHYNILTIVCVYCGQVREVDMKGNVRVVTEYGKINTHDPSSSDTKHS